MSSHEDRLDRLFGALSDRTRRKMLARLSKGPARVTELGALFEISLPAVSRHIRVLEDAALVRRRIDGRVHRCSLAAGPLRNIERWLRRYRCFWRDNLDSLARYAEELES